MEPIKLEIFMKDLTRAGLQSVKGNLGDIKQNTLAVVAMLEKELAGMQAKAKQAAAQGVIDPAQMADVQAMTGMVNGLKEELAELEKQKKKTNDTPLMQNDPAPKLNSVKMSMAQIAREMPTLAMGPQMFFLAISNNIPMFTDALASARKEHDLLVASGQKATPVWKQVLSSLFSWQTGMATLITLSVVYGKEIGNFIKSLWNARKTSISLAESQKQVNKEFISNSEKVGEQIAKIKALQTEWNNLGESIEKKNKFIKDSKEKFEDLGVAVNNIKDAENLLVTNTPAFIEAMSLRAKAAAAQELASKEYAKMLEAESDKRNAGKTSAFQAVYRGLFEIISNNGGKKENSFFDTQISQAKVAGDAYTELGIKAEEAAKKILDAAGINGKNKKEATSGKSALDYQNELADARIRAQQKLEAARIAVMQDGYKKRQALARQELDEDIARIDKEERDTLQKMQEAKKKGVKITPEEEKQVTADANMHRALATDKYIKDYYRIEKEWRDKNIQSWIDYNKEYGTFQQKRLAITQDYNLKMQQEGLTDGEKAKLGKDMEAELRDLNMKEFKDSINFADVFGDLDAQSTEALDVLRGKLKEFINNAAKDLKPDDLKTLQDAFKDIDIEIKGRKPFRELKKDLADYKAAQADVEKAQTELNQVVKFGNLLIEDYDEETGEVTRRLLTQAEAEKNLTDAQKKRKEAMSGLIKSMGGVSVEISNIANAANSILSTFDMLGVEVGEDVQGVVDGFNAVSDGISNVVAAAQSGDIAGVLAGTIGTVGGAVKTLGSLFGADWGGEKSRRRYEEAKEKYESYMNVLDQVISKQKELVASMESEDFANADNSYERARDLLKKQQDYAREMGKAYLNSGASKGILGIGSSASEGTKQRKDISSSAWEQARKALGSDFNKVADGRMTGLFDLAYEQLVKLRDEAGGFWGELHQDTQDYLNQIIESEEAWQEVQEARKEALTKIDFGSFYDSFVSTLADMDATSEDFADNFEKHLQNAIFSALVASKYKKSIEDLYASWADMAESDKKLTDTEANDLRDQYNQIVKDMLAEREQIMKDFGWSASSSSTSESQSGRAGAVTTITEDTGNEIVGIGNNMLDKMVAFNDLLVELKKGREADSEILAEIAENTAYCKMLEPLLELFERWETNRFKITM